MNGLKNIQDVEVGDMVATRQGYYPVKYTMNHVADTMTVKFSNGKTLTGTPDHPVWVKGKGHIALHALRYNDIIETWKERQLYSKASNITVIRQPKIGRVGCISRPQITDFMKQFGKILTALSQIDFVFIIRMVTHSIINWKTYLASQLASICHYMARNVTMMRNILKAYGYWQLNGIVPQLEESGIRYMVKYPLKTVDPLNLPASSVIRLTKEYQTEIIDSVPIGAKQGIVTLVKKTMWLKPVLSVVRNLLSTNMPEQKHVPVSVVRVKPNKKSTVYNLTVDTVHEYFANGILVTPLIFPVVKLSRSGVIADED
jgi:hypothetical protein